jgi:hypothetical protein
MHPENGNAVLEEQILNILDCHLKESAVWLDR